MATNMGDGYIPPTSTGVGMFDYAGHSLKESTKNVTKAILGGVEGISNVLARGGESYSRTIE